MLNQADVVLPFGISFALPRKSLLDFPSSIGTDSMTATLEAIDSDRLLGPKLTDDGTLLVRYRDRVDREAFRLLVERYEHELFNYLFRLTQDRQLAEDLFQTVFLQVHLKCDQFDNERRFRPWLYRIATNLAIDNMRRSKSRPTVSLHSPVNSKGDTNRECTIQEMLAANGESVTVQLETAELGNHLRQIVDALPDLLQPVVNLVFYQGLKYREAAEVLRIPVGTVKSRLHSAIHKLNEHWNNTHTQ